MRTAFAVLLVMTTATAAAAASSLGAGAVSLPSGPTSSQNRAGSAAGNSPIGSASGTGGAQQMHATPGMTEKPMSFNMQDLGKTPPAQRKHKP